MTFSRLLRGLTEGRGVGITLALRMGEGDLTPVSAELEGGWRGLAIAGVCEEARTAVVVAIDIEISRVSLR